MTTVVYLTANQVKARYGGVSDMSLWRWRQDQSSGFPNPIMVGGKRLWLLADLEAWEQLRSGKGAGEGKASAPVTTKPPAQQNAPASIEERISFLEAQVRELQKQVAVLRDSLLQEKLLPDSFSGSPRLRRSSALARSAVASKEVGKAR